MDKLWILRGELDAPGWKELRADLKEEKVDIIHLDPKVWAILNADEAPQNYDGLTATEPNDGLYIDPNGSPLYIVAGRVVAKPETVIEALGDEAQAALEKIGDPYTVLERLGRVF